MPHHFGKVYLLSPLALDGGLFGNHWLPARSHIFLVILATGEDKIL